MIVTLYANNGTTIVAFVSIEPTILTSDVISWGSRTFVRQLDGSYREGLATVAQDIVLPATGFLGVRNQDPTF